MSKNISNFFQAYCALLIWNPDLMNFIKDKNRRRSRRLFYRAMGLVEHDRMLNYEVREDDRPIQL